MDIGDKLRKARQSLGQTQEQVAEAVGVSRQTVSNWETGRSLPDVLSVIRLSDLYGVSLDQLLKGDDTMLHHIEESTNTVKSRQRLARLLEVLSFLVVWAVCVAMFWLGGGSDAMGYSILVMYLVLPVTTFVCSLLMGLDTSWRERQWLFLLYFGVGYVLLPYGTFSTANMLTTGTFRLPEWQYILYGTVFAMQGLCLGSAIRWGRALRRSHGDKCRPLWVFGVVWGSTAFLLFSLNFYEFAALLLSAVSPALGEVFVSHLRQVLGEALLLLHLAASGAAALWAGWQLRKDAAWAGKKWLALPLCGLAFLLGGGLGACLVPTEPVDPAREPWLWPVAFCLGAALPGMGMALGHLWDRLRRRNDPRPGEKSD